MEDENGLELSLGLACGGSSGKGKTKDAPTGPRVQEGSTSRHDHASTASFKNFFQENEDQNEKQKNVPLLRQQENFWADLGKYSMHVVNDAHGNPSQFPRFQELLATTGKAAGAEEEKAGSSKRKLPFEDVNAQKKQERVTNLVESLGKSPDGVPSVKTSRISATTEDGSSGENEEVAESEAEGSNSWLISQREEHTKNFDTSKFTDKYVINDPSGKQAIVSGNESKQELGKVAYGIPFSLQPLTVMTVPYPVPVEVPAATNVPNATVFPSPCVMQIMPAGNGERPTAQPMSSSNLQLAFGYSSMQLPTLETGSSWAFGSQPQHASVNSREVNAATNSENPEHLLKISHASVQALTSAPSDLMKASGKHAGDTSTSSLSRAEDKGKRISAAFMPKEMASQPSSEGFPLGVSVIRPGIAPNVKFGGCGSHPDLPWVSTTGPGPNGRTISGVTYKYSNDQIKIVCACHGSHMTPEEFVQHASEDAPSQESSAGLTSFPSSKPAASAQS